MQVCFLPSSSLASKEEIVSPDYEPYSPYPSIHLQNKPERSVISLSLSLGEVHFLYRALPRCAIAQSLPPHVDPFEKALAYSLASDPAVAAVL